jgi:hypothetical protein
MAGLTDAGNFDAYLAPSVTIWNSGTATSTAVQFQTAGMDTILAIHPIISWRVAPRRRR